MSGSVIHIAHTIAPEELRSLLRPAQAGDEGVKFVHVANHPDQSDETNLIRMARADATAKACLIELVKSGYYPYVVKEGATRLVRSDQVRKLWLKIKENEYQITDDEVVYFVENPLEEKTATRLLVVFSSIHQHPSTASLQRYFMLNFPTIQKYMPPGTAILRIGDLGGVVGSFYLNTTHRPDNATSVRRLIEHVRTSMGIPEDRVVLYGVSKGATAALYHGIGQGYRFVAVDPIISDEHYERNHNDLHFTAGGVFPESKDKVFENLLDQFGDEGSMGRMRGRSAVICSERSPQFAYLSRSLISRFVSGISFFNSRDPLINDHPDVGPRTVNCATMLMSMQLYGLQVPTGMMDLD